MNKQEFLDKVSKHCSKTLKSYKLEENEKKLAQQLVKESKLFYNFDYDHVMAYKLSHDVEEC